MNINSLQREGAMEGSMEGSMEEKNMSEWVGE
jgi:hypothetical protein